MQKVFASIPMDLCRLENWALRNLMKFDKGKYEDLHLGRNIPFHQYMLVASQLESPLAEKAVGVLVEPLFNMDHHCVLGAKKADSILGCIKHIIASGAKQGPSFLLSTGETAGELEH